MAKTSYSPELYFEIMTRYAAGETLLNISKDIGIPRTTILTWAHKNQAHEDLFALAKQSCAGQLFDQGTEILHRLENYQKPPGVEAKEASAWVTAQRVAAENKTRIAGILSPREYGPKQELITREEGVNYCVSFVPLERLLKIGAVVVEHDGRTFVNPDFEGPIPGHIDLNNPQPKRITRKQTEAGFPTPKDEGEHE